MKFFTKLNFYTSLFLILFNINAKSEVVNKVSIEGNDRISLETVMIFADITIGKNYESNDITLLIKKLYETKFFSNITAEIENNKLSITVKENPIINTITIYMDEKAKKYQGSSFKRKSLYLEKRTSFVKNYLKKDVNTNKRLFTDMQGFYFS